MLGRREMCSVEQFIHVESKLIGCTQQSIFAKHNYLQFMGNISH